jgi:hypothetical protein
MMHQQMGAKWNGQLFNDSWLFAPMSRETAQDPLQTRRGKTIAVVMRMTLEIGKWQEKKGEWWGRDQQTWTKSFATCAAKETELVKRWLFKTMWWDYDNCGSFTWSNTPDITSTGISRSILAESSMRAVAGKSSAMSCVECERDEKCAVPLSAGPAPWPPVWNILSPSWVNVEDHDATKGTGSGRGSREESSGGEPKEEVDVDAVVGLKLRRAARRDGAIKGIG